MFFSDLDDQPKTSLSRIHASTSSRLQRQSLAALRRHLRSLDKAAAAPVVITLNQSSETNLIGVASPSSSTSSSSSSSYTTPPMAAAGASLQQQQSAPPPLLRRSTRHAVSLSRQTRARSWASADVCDETTRQKLLALYRRAGNCLRFRVNELRTARIAH